MRMSTTTIDTRRYAALLSETLPAVIRTRAEYRRMMSAAKDLIERPDEQITPEEGRLLELLSMLIEEYENRTQPTPKVPASQMLAHLLQERGMKPSDLWAILPKSRVSEILTGKRGISKVHAMQLAELFRVPAELLF
jgi:HTH-type transcriptional regulator / antitoxin HigA